MPNAYLLKTEPSEYSFANLQRDKKTLWDGVSNPVALRNLSAMKAGDHLIIYETGDHKSAVGTASVVSVKATDPKNPQVLAEMEKRDRADRTRRDSPLRHDETYVIVDSSDRNPEDVVAEIERRVRASG